MKKKIAVFANGYNTESLKEALKGIQRFSEKADWDIFVFMCFASYGEEQAHNIGELNIYTLPHTEDFDGIIVFSNHLNAPHTAEKLCRDAKEKNIPVVSIGMPLEGIPSINFSNEEGMRALITHLVEAHGVKRIAFLSGPADHSDCIARLNATRETLSKYGLSLKEEDIAYSDWGNTVPRMVINQMIEKKDFPDALVCANDTMAMAAFTQFIRNGYSVPEDMIITGFDNSTYGQKSYPALTTVDPNFPEIGYQSCQILWDQILGKDAAFHHTVPSRFARAESCGCIDHPDYVNLRKYFCKYSYQNFLESTAIEMFERLLLQSMSGTNGYESLKEQMQDHFNRNHFFEGDDFHIIVDHDYFEKVITEENAGKEIAYEEQMDVIVSLKNGQPLPNLVVDRHELIPGYEKTDGEQHVYYFLPLHNQQYNYAYVVFKDDAAIMQQDKANPYLEKLQESVKMLCINLRLNRVNQDLKRVYNRDPMTGLYNRLAYEEKAELLYKQSLKDKTTMMVMFVDINYMKRINDQYGHLHGDNAIKLVAESIKSVLKKDWIAVRFGGDEFLLIASNCDRELAAEVRLNILSCLARKNHEESLPFEISASCGYVITNPDMPSHLQEYVKEADNLMYQIKQEVHARDGKPRYS